MLFARAPYACSLRVLPMRALYARIAETLFTTRSELSSPPYQAFGQGADGQMPRLSCGGAASMRVHGWDQGTARSGAF